MSTVRCQTRAQHGFSLIEIMIGIVIGLIAVLVIYQVFALAEGIKRNTTSVGDAQQNGLLSSFILNVQLANANNGYAYAMKELATCTPTADPATTFRPIPVLITPGASATDPDSFVLNYSQAQRMPAPAPFIGPRLQMRTIRCKARSDSRPATSSWQFLLPAIASRRG